MAQLQDLVLAHDSGGPPIGLVSITVDPRHDTPAVLAEYGSKFSADPSVWSFLTGSENDIRDVVAGFRQALEVGPTNDSEIPDILHSQRFILVDITGTIRGFYETDPEGLAAMWRDVEWLVAHPDG